MLYFSQGNNFLDYQNAGETIRIIPWGSNSFRVVSVPNGPLDLDCSSLLDVPFMAAKIVIDENSARITNGKISAVVDTSSWNSAAVVSFFNHKNELLLKEIDSLSFCR